ncbi:MAG: hypothetical protein RLZZ454_1910 [Pseudomonadota bacterium]
MHPLLPLTLGIAVSLLSACQMAPLQTASSDIFANPTPQSLPLIEKRESLTATGYAVISIQNHRTPAQQRLLAIRAAKLDAYRSLTEQVYGLRLDATATVADMVVQNDTFRDGGRYGGSKRHLSQPR